MARSKLATMQPEDKAEEARVKRLGALGSVLDRKRKDAIEGRQNAGIDEQWREDIEFYEGIDDANREEMTGGNGAFTSKPPGQIIPNGEDDDDTGSTVFINITRPYCDAAAARIGDMLMPTDERSFGIKPTPVPELENMAKGQLSLSMKQSMLQQIPTNIPAEAQQSQLSQVLRESIQKAQLVMEEAKERAKKAQDRIDDWHVECQYHAEARRLIDDASKMGTGVLKGPVPTRKKHRSVSRDPQTGNLTLNLLEKVSPISKRIDPRNLFPDPACGDNIHNGSYLFERDYLSRKKVEELGDQPKYLRSQLDKVLFEGPKWAGGELPGDQDKRDTNSKDLFEVWYFYGALTPDDMEAMGCPCRDDKGQKSQKPVQAVVTMINDCPVKAVRNQRKYRITVAPSACTS